MRCTLLLVVCCAGCGRFGFEEQRTGCELTCDDGNPCTDDICSDGGCIHLANTASCDDGDSCTIGDRCVAKLCGPGPATGCASTTRQIFRSVGVGTGAALAVGGQVSISGTTATFTSPLPDNVGVGDAIQYDTNNDGTEDAIAFVHGRLSSTVYAVRDQTGGTPMPADTPNWGAFRAYLSLANAVDRTRGGTHNPFITAAFDGYTGGRDLVAANEQLSIACYDDGNVDPLPVEICSTSYTRSCTTGAWTTDATHYIRIFTPTLPSEVGVTQRHPGYWAGGYRRSDGMIMYEGFVHIDGMSLHRGSAGIGRAYYVETEGHGGEVWISNSFGWSSITGASKVYDIWDTGVAALGPTYTIYKLWNDIAYNETTADARSGFYINSNRAEADIYACTSYVKGGGAFYESSTARATLKNCLGYSEANPAFAADNGFQSVTGSISNDVSLSGIANGSSNQWNQSVAFVNAPASDFHLAANPPAALRSGANLSTDPVLSFSDDIDGTMRPSGSWDIGADQAP